MIEYENIFNDRFIMFKTTSLEGFRTIKEKDRKCNTCSKYNIPEKDMCIPVGIIANPDCPYCSWYKSKHEKKIETKRCSSCREIKSVDKFNKQEDCKYGITSWCKICQGEYAKTYYENNSEKIKEYGRKYGKEYYKNKPKRFYAYTKEYRKNNPEKIKDWFKKSRKKRELNPMFKLNDRISNLIKQSLRNNKNGKSGKHWEDLVGYNLQDLMSHLEKLFKPGMTFDNHGKWHIDHRRPVSSFNFNSYKDKEFLECWTLSNLQPLWARENISKGAKYEN